MNPLFTTAYVHYSFAKSMNDHSASREKFELPSPTMARSTKTATPRMITVSDVQANEKGRTW